MGLKQINWWKSLPVEYQLISGYLQTLYSSGCININGLKCFLLLARTWCFSWSNTALIVKVWGSILQISVPKLSYRERPVQSEPWLMGGVVSHTCSSPQIPGTNQTLQKLHRNDQIAEGKHCPTGRVSHNFNIYWESVWEKRIEILYITPTVQSGKTKCPKTWLSQSKIFWIFFLLPLMKTWMLRHERWMR